MTMNNRLSSIGQGTDVHRHLGAWLPRQGACNLIHRHQHMMIVGASGFNSAFLQCPDRCKSQCPAQTIGQQDGPRMLEPGLWAFSITQLTWQNTGRATHVCCVSNMLLASHSMCYIVYKASVPAIALHGLVTQHRWCMVKLLSQWTCCPSLPFDRCAAINICNPNTWQPNQ